MDIMLHMPWNRLLMGIKSVLFIFGFGDFFVFYNYVAQFRHGAIMFTAPNLALAFINDEEGYFLQIFCEMWPECVFLCNFLYLF